MFVEPSRRADALSTPWGKARDGLVSLCGGGLNKVPSWPQARLPIIVSEDMPRRKLFPAAALIETR